MTGAKTDLIQQSLSSEDRFLADWQALDVDGPDGDPLPFCPCSSAHLYQAYERWCNTAGERARRAQELIGLASKKPGWQAGKPANTWATLLDASVKKRRMVIPSVEDMALAVRHCKAGTQDRLQRERFDSTGHWLTAGHFAFHAALGENKGYSA